MLRECRRTLKPGGRIAGFVIHHAEGLGEGEIERAFACGPFAADLPMPLGDLLSAAGLRVILLTDLTDRFKRMADALRDERTRQAAALRAQEGDELFEEEQERKAQISAAIAEGLLLRTLVVAER